MHDVHNASSRLLLFLKSDLSLSIIGNTGQGIDTGNTQSSSSSEDISDFSSNWSMIRLSTPSSTTLQIALDLRLKWSNSPRERSIALSTSCAAHSTWMKEQRSVRHWIRGNCERETYRREIRLELFPSHCIGAGCDETDGGRMEGLNDNEFNSWKRFHSKISEISWGQINWPSCQITLYFIFWYFFYEPLYFSPIHCLTFGSPLGQSWTIFVRAGRRMG